MNNDFKVWILRAGAAGFTAGGRVILPDAAHLVRATATRPPEVHSRFVLESERELAWLLDWIWFGWSSCCTALDRGRCRCEL